MIYKIESLELARQFLKKLNSGITLSNPPGATRYYGMRVIDYMFQTLKQEFPNIIRTVIVDVGDDYSAFITARKLGYQTIQYIPKL